MDRGDISTDIAETVAIDFSLLFNVPRPYLLALSIRWLPFMVKHFYELEDSGIRLAERLAKLGYNVEFFAIVPKHTVKHFEKFFKQVSIDYLLTVHSNLYAVSHNPIYSRVIVSRPEWLLSIPRAEFVQPSYRTLETNKAANQFLLDKLEFFIERGWNDQK